MSAGTRRRLLRAEAPRKAVHMGAGLIALALPWLTREIALGAAALAFVGNLLWWRFRRDAGVFRPGESALGGIVLYPLVVFAAIALLPYPGGAMTVWAVLAFGDASATLAGMTFGGPRWTHAPKKTLVGSLACFLVGGLVASGYLMIAGLAFPAAAARGFCAAGLGAITETLPLRIDDNVLVGVGAALGYLVFEVGS